VEGVKQLLTARQKSGSLRDNQKAVLSMWQRAAGSNNDVAVLLQQDNFTKLLQGISCRAASTRVEYIRPVLHVLDLEQVQQLLSEQELQQLKQQAAAAKQQFTQAAAATKKAAAAATDRAAADAPAAPVTPEAAAATAAAPLRGLAGKREATGGSGGSGSGGVVVASLTRGSQQVGSCAALNTALSQHRVLAESPAAYMVSNVLQWVEPAVHACRSETALGCTM
jgi:hypothetical protein